MKFEPLIVHLFKLFTRAQDLKNEEEKKTKTPVSNKGKPNTQSKDYDQQKMKNSEQ